MQKMSIKLCRKCKYYWGYDNGMPICGRFVLTWKRKESPIGYCNEFEAGPHLMGAARSPRSLFGGEKNDA